MGADDDVGGLRLWFLSLITAVVEMRAEMQLAAALDLAAALLDRMLDLERIEGGLRIEAHQLLGVVWRGIGGRAALPEHGAQAERLEGRDLFDAQIVARDGIDDLAAAQPARGDQLGDGGARMRGLAEADIDRQAEERRESCACHDVEIERVAVGIRILCRLPRGLDVRPVAGDPSHELRNGLCETGPGGIRCQSGRRIGWRRRRDLRSLGDKRRDSVRPCRAEQIVGIARSLGHGDACIDGKGGLARCVDAGVRVAVGLGVVVGDKDEIGVGKPRPQRLGDGQQVARIHRRDDHVARRDVQAGTRLPSLRRSGSVHRARRAVRAPRPPPRNAPASRRPPENAWPRRGDGLEAVQMPVDILQRDDELAARVHAQRERAGLLGGEIGMISGRRLRVGPDPGSAGGRRVRGRDRRGAFRGRTGSPGRWRRPVGRCAPCLSRWGMGRGPLAMPMRSPIHAVAPSRAIPRSRPTSSENQPPRPSS